ncbi:hypothetical protein QJQ45_020616 [Haematococcus lacustris]|nr:hypothetical protein QJQ45_014339 [Haematococcus lacustris]KAJ9528714.1 hypothetical protein QJQ45_020616 [Haematococcus lacustris]
MRHGAISSQGAVGGVLGCIPDGVDPVLPLGALIAAFLALCANLKPKFAMGHPGPRRCAAMAHQKAIRAKVVSSGSGSGGNLHCDIESHTFPSNTREGSGYISLRKDPYPECRASLQCAKFHSLNEFDGTKKSCRKRLSQHNARRRRRVGGGDDDADLLQSSTSSFADRPSHLSRTSNLSYSAPPPDELEHGAFTSSHPHFNCSSEPHLHSLEEDAHPGLPSGAVSHCLSITDTAVATTPPFASGGALRVQSLLALGRQSAAGSAQHALADPPAFSPISRRSRGPGSPSFAAGSSALQSLAKVNGGDVRKARRAHTSLQPHLALFTGDQPLRSWQAYSSRGPRSVPLHGEAIPGLCATPGLVSGPQACASGMSADSLCPDASSHYTEASFDTQEQSAWPARSLSLPRSRRLALTVDPADAMLATLSRAYGSSSCHTAPPPPESAMFPQAASEGLGSFSSVPQVQELQQHFFAHQSSLSRWHQEQWQQQQQWQPLDKAPGMVLDTDLEFPELGNLPQPMPIYSAAPAMPHPASDFAWPSGRGATQLCSTQPPSLGVPQAAHRQLGAEGEHRGPPDELVVMQRLHQRNQLAVFLQHQQQQRQQWHQEQLQQQQQQPPQAQGSKHAAIPRDSDVEWHPLPRFDLGLTPSPPHCRPTVASRSCYYPPCPTSTLMPHTAELLDSTPLPLRSSSSAASALCAQQPTSMCFDGDDLFVEEDTLDSLAGEDAVLLDILGLEGPGLLDLGSPLPPLPPAAKGDQEVAAASSCTAASTHPVGVHSRAEGGSTTVSLQQALQPMSGGGQVVDLVPGAGSLTRGEAAARGRSSRSAGLHGSRVHTVTGLCSPGTLQQQQQQHTNAPQPQLGQQRGQGHGSEGQQRRLWQLQQQCKLQQPQCHQPRHSNWEELRDACTVNPVHPSDPMVGSLAAWHPAMFSQPGPAMPPMSQHAAPSSPTLGHYPASTGQLGQRHRLPDCPPAFGPHCEQETFAGPCGAGPNHRETWAGPRGARWGLGGSMDMDSMHSASLISPAGMDRAGMHSTAAWQLALAGNSRGKQAGPGRVTQPPLALDLGGGQLAPGSGRLQPPGGALWHRAPPAPHHSTAWASSECSPGPGSGLGAAFPGSSCSPGWLMPHGARLQLPHPAGAQERS